MLVAADDPRVITEYGKTLAAMGRADEAVNFLTRAQQLQPNDWTVYSALGVAYDQSGDQKNAQINYEHALALKPGEPSVLNNYALSRMLAKDPDMALKLASRAEIAKAAPGPQDRPQYRDDPVAGATKRCERRRQHARALACAAPVSPRPRRCRWSPDRHWFRSASPRRPRMASSAPRPINANAVGVARSCSQPVQPHSPSPTIAW